MVVDIVVAAAVKTTPKNKNEQTKDDRKTALVKQSRGLKSTGKKPGTTRTEPLTRFSTKREGFIGATTTVCDP